MRTTAALILTLACTIASADWVDKRGAGLPDTSYRKSAGDLVAQLVFVKDEQDLFRSWSKPAESVDVKDIDSTAIDSPISALIVFGGCKPDVQGNCSVVMRFRVIGPDGKLYSETPVMEVWHAKMPPPNRSLQLSVDYLKVIVEPHEQRGKYVVDAEVWDNNAGSTVRLQKVFTAANRDAE